EQFALWSAGYVVLALLTLVCAGVVWRSAPYVRQDVCAVPSNAEHRGVGSHWRWMALAFVPSSLLLGVTTTLTTDLAPMPLLWVGPLALYLLTFVLVFARRPPIPHEWMVRALPPAVMGLVPVLASGLVQPFWIPLHLATFFVAAMVCHGALARLRPGVSEL